MSLFVECFRSSSLLFSFSSIGFSSKIFAELNDELIAEAEVFCREHLEEYLKCKCIVYQIAFDSIDKKLFWGKFESNPQNFCFHAEEREIIFTMVNCVKEHLIDIENDFAHLTIFDSDSSKYRWYFEKDEFPPEEVAVTEIFPQSEPTSQTHYVLKKLLATANQNYPRSKQGYRFDSEIKMWCAFIRMIAGTGYQVLQKNLELAMPSMSSLNKFIQRTNKLVEGVLRAEDLLSYLKERNLPLFVSISEDGTRINGRVQYDPRLNQLVGFVLPTNNDTGMPVPLSYHARNTAEIVKHFCNDTNVANSVNTIMVQPIGNAPPFCLLIYGTDGKYTADNVSSRWNHTVEKLKELGIVTLTIASDSDPKYNGGMRKNSNLGHETTYYQNKKWFSCGNNIEPPFYIQDPTHIITKMRNFFLKTLKNNKLLPFGEKHFIQVDHLRYLLLNFPKDR